jgi:hypothetical protein
VLVGLAGSNDRVDQHEMPAPRISEARQIVTDDLAYLPIRYGVRFSPCARIWTSRAALSLGRV